MQYSHLTEQIKNHNRQVKALSRQLRSHHQDLKIESSLNHAIAAMLRVESSLLLEQRRALRRQRTVIQLELNLAQSQQIASLRLQLAALLHPPGGAGALANGAQDPL